MSSVLPLRLRTYLTMDRLLRNNVWSFHRIASAILVIVLLIRLRMLKLHKSLAGSKILMGDRCGREANRTEPNDTSRSAVSHSAVPLAQRCVRSSNQYISYAFLIIVLDPWFLLDFLIKKLYPLLSSPLLSSSLLSSPLLSSAFICIFIAFFN